MNELYFRSLDRRWKKELASAPGETMVMSPYLTSRTADLVLESIAPEVCNVYTYFSVRNFLTGASSIVTVRRLFDLGYPLFDIPKLHAKVVVVPPKFVSIGSQNLTLRGTQNREASVVLKSQRDVSKVQRLLQAWILESTPITQDMIAAVEEFVKVHTEQQNALLGLADVEEQRIFDVAHTTGTPGRLNAARTHLATVGESYGGVPEQLAFLLVWESAWWYDHPAGPVRARGDANRLELRGQEFILDLGNIFLVSRAIVRCAHVARSFLDSAQQGRPWPLDDLKERMRYELRRSAEYKGSGYEATLYDLWGRTTHMKFGTHSINTEAFINSFLRQMEILPGFFPD